MGIDFRATMPDLDEAYNSRTGWAPHEPMSRYTNPAHPPLNYYREDARPSAEALKMLTAARRISTKGSELGLASAFALESWQASAKKHWQRKAQEDATRDVIGSAFTSVLTLVSPGAGLAVVSLDALAKGNGGTSKAGGITVPVLSQYAIVYNQGMRLLSNMREFAQGLPIRDYGSVAELESAAIGITSNLREMASRLENAGYDAEARECRDLHLAIESQRGTLGAAIGQAVGSIPSAIGGAVSESVGALVEGFLGDGDGEDGDGREVPWGIIGVAAAAVVGLLILIR